MEKNKLLHADYLDIIFGDRNKRYGGYELRSHYPQRARKALMTVAFSVCVVSAIPVVASHLSKRNVLVKPLVYDRTTVIAELPKPVVEPPKPPLRVQPPPPPPPAIKWASMRVVANNEVIEPPKSLEEIKGKTIGLVTQPGTGNSDFDDPGIIGGTGTKKVLDVVGGGDGPAKPFVSVEQMPVFNGDIADYLLSHLQFPELEKEDGISGNVVVRFVVNEDGGISDAEVVRHGRQGFEREALRVISGMPKWKPGRQNGRAVKVYFTLPITFSLGN